MDANHGCILPRERGLFPPFYEPDSITELVNQGLGRENPRLKRPVAAAEPDEAIRREAAAGNF